MEAVYLETSFISYLVAESSRNNLVAAHQQVTRDWWRLWRRECICVFSMEVRREIMKGYYPQVQKRLSTLDELVEVDITDFALLLADAFFATGALPESARADALHLAVATAAGCDYLLTWNCRHLANEQVLRIMSKEAIKYDIQLPKVCTPLKYMELRDDETRFDT